MAVREKSMIINSPVDRVYNVWVYFQEFPKFMNHVKEVDIKSPTKSHWKVELAGMQLDFDAEITELKENKYLAWKSIKGLKNSGHVSFEEVPEGTKVTLSINYEPQSYPEMLTSMLERGKMVEDQIDEDLNNLKTRAEKMEKAA